MIYEAAALEKGAVMQAAERMCAAARTAPKTKGVDHIRTCVLTGEEKEALAQEMERIADAHGYAFIHRDADNLRAAQAVVLIGTTEERMGLGALCGYCHYADCAKSAEENGVCVYNMIDLGIALGSAASVAADARIDNRVMFSVGRAALQLALLGEEVQAIMAIPLSASGKSPFFDRKPK